MTAQDFAAVYEHARATYPKECCGLLAGRIEPDGAVVVTRVVQSPNTASPPRADRFEVDPQVRLDLMRALRDSDEEMVGHYHSHPDHPAKPSDTDLSMAFEPDLVWLIVSTDTAGPQGARAWQLNRETGQTRELPLSVLA